MEGGELPEEEWDGLEGQPMLVVILVVVVSG